MADESSDPKIAGAAEALALGAPGTLDPRAAAYLEKQGRLADLQSQNLIDLNAFELSHLRWRRFGDQMSGAFQAMLALIALVIVIGLGMAIWAAANDRGLVVEAFSVPPDLAAKGLTGEVIATKVLDRLAAFQAQTVSSRASESYANNWGGDIKVQIPNTGISIGEFNRALRQWLGHETHISGEVYRTPTGLALSARVGGDSTPVFKGNEAEIDALIEQAAERIYRSTQPYRYAMRLAARGRVAESNTILQSIVDTGTARERGWAYNGMAHNRVIYGDIAGTNVFEQKAIDSDPGLALPQANLADNEVQSRHDEAALALTRRTLRTGLRGDATMSERGLARIMMIESWDLATLLGDYAGAVDFARKERSSDLEDGRENEIVACALQHDLSCVDAGTTALPVSVDEATNLFRIGALQRARAALGQWDALAKAAPSFHDGLSKNAYAEGWDRLYDAPLHALASAHLGDMKLAHALIGTTPLDCVMCLRFRGQIDALERNWNGAGYWFARASHIAPSIPVVDSDWGQMLMAKGDLEGAIAKFESANRKGPHFADPLEMWGEALIARNRSDLAVAKFEEANKYAPNWGRLHLKWGEALWWSGKRDEAKKQFAAAAGLAMTPAEKSELAKVSAHG